RRRATMAQRRYVGGVTGNGAGREGSEDEAVSVVRMGRCATCGTAVLWLPAWGFGEPRPLDLHPVPDGEVVIDPVDARHRAYVANGAPAPHRYRLHWPCPAVAPSPFSAHIGTAPVGERSENGTKVAV